jgi:uncharacterized membrane protein
VRTLPPSVVIKFDRLIAADRYSDGRDTGSFILIDPETCDTVALGIIEAVTQSEPAKARLFHFIRSTEAHVRSMAKAITWRAFGGLNTFAIAALITGSSKLAGGVALAEILTKTVLYYIHERVWALLRWGRR